MFMCLLFQITWLVMSSCKRMFYLSLTDHLSINNFAKQEIFALVMTVFNMSNRINEAKNKNVRYSALILQNRCSRETSLQKNVKVSLSQLLLW